MSDISFPSVSSYLDNGSIKTVNEVLSNYPASASYVGMYVRVSDLYGSVDDIMRCRFDGTNYRWVPQRENFGGTTAVSQGTISLRSLVTPPTLRMTTATLLNNVNVTPLSDNSFIGERRRIIAPPSLPISGYVMQVTGLIGSNISLLAGKTIDIEYGPTGWFQST